MPKLLPANEPVISAGEATGNPAGQSVLKFQWAFCWAVIAAVLVLGWFLCELLDVAGLTTPHLRTGNAAFFLFGAYDRILLLPLAATSGLMYVLWSRPVTAGKLNFGWATSQHWLLIAGLTVLVVTAAGTFLVCQNFPLAMDEYFAVLQAQLFRRGLIFAPIAPEWQAYGPAMTSPLLAYDPAMQRWAIAYLPVYSAMRALFGWVGLEFLTNAVLSGACVLLTAIAARRLWPEDRKAPLLAVILLASSAQFLIYGMTAYSMQAHLCLNLAWLVLYLSPAIGPRAWAPWVGVLALGLHQPNVHALFVAPFLLRMVWERKWRWATYHAAVYSLGIVLWVAWTKLRIAPVTPDGLPGADSSFGALGKLFSLPGIRQYFQQFMSGDLFIGWNSLLLTALLILAVLRIRHLDRPLRDLAIGLLLTIPLYLCFAPGQGHGWGHRYLQPYLGNCVLLAVAGYRMLESGSEPRALKLQRLLVASTCLAIVIQSPLRLWEVREFTSPFASASRYLNSLPTDVVVLNYQHSWYAEDLVRNSPDANQRPKIMFAARLTREDGLRLKDRYKVIFVDHSKLSRFGLFEISPPKDEKP